MKKLNRMKCWIPIFMGSFIILLSACDRKESNSTEYSNLTDALALAWENADADLPNAELKEILGDDIQTDGTTEEGWSFYFGKYENNTGYSYGIDIDPDGSVFSWDPGGMHVYIGINDYTSTDAARWVQEADEATPWIDKTQNYRELQVRSEDGDGDAYPQATDHVFIFYKPDSGGEPVTWVQLDAEDYEILHVEPNP